MRCLQNRHSHKRGASMVIALVFLLLCTMVGTVVITSATAGIGAVISERQDARRTLALTSAAEYVSAELQKATYTASYIETETVTSTYVEKEVEGEKTYVLSSGVNPNPSTGYAYSTPIVGMKDSTLFANLDLSPLSTVDTNGSRSTSATVTYSFDLSVMDSNSAYNIPDVSAKLTLDANYNATLVLTCDSDSMTLTFPAAVKESTKRAATLSSNSSHSNPYTDVTMDTSADTITSTKTTETTHTTTVTWGEPTIVKGGSTT